MADKKIKIRLVHSAVGRPRRQKETVKGLGFTKLNQICEVVDTEATRGMINKISHLVKVVQ
ncbi:MAG: 50S ribosomal protein L30 [Deltaproteobacteria bacterium]|nr:50S ribosomal protein L30 [Deltaproteobacteria bacterium]